MKNKKSLGQHWLKNRAILDEIAELAHAGADENTVCLEIGPGLGTLTSSLLRRFLEVIAIEYDQNLAQNLPKSFPGKNLRVINDDILAINLAEVLSTDNYVVAGNIPYYITSPIIRQLLSATPKARTIVLLVQKEVAERVAAEPGKLSLIAVMTQNLAAVELGPVVRAEEFTPPPKVDSQVLILRPWAESVLSAEALKLAAKGFSSPRKKLAHNLADSKRNQAAWEKILVENDLSPNVRAQDLELIDWEHLQKVSKIEKNLAKK